MKFSQAVDAVKAENFTIAGASVTAASLSADKKTATLEVSGLDYAKSYTVAVKNVLVNGKEAATFSKSFTTPALANTWTLQVTSKANQLVANGADNTEVTFKLVDKNGQVDTKADDIVLALTTTHGSLAKSRATIENGVATVVLTSEFSATELSAKIDAQIIEASGDYKDLIGKIVGAKTVKFTPADSSEVKKVSIVSAESNQADRITLFFDKEVSLNTFIATDEEGNLLYEVVGKQEPVPANEIEADDVVIAPVLINESAIVVSQDDNFNYNFKRIRGLKPVAGNPKAIQVILEKDTPLTDNKKVDVAAILGSSNKLNGTYSITNFKLTDARDPEVTSVTAEDASTLKVKFSEAMADATLKIDGQYDVNGEFGEFNPVTLEDNRDVATIELNDNYDEDGIADTNPANKTIAGYFSNGSHSLQVSSAKDFASLTDRNNEGTTQNLTFNVGNTAEKPGATVKVESPEQFRVAFDKPLKEQNPATRLTNLADEIIEANTQLKFEVYNEKTKKYENVIGNTKFGGLTVVTKLSDLLNITQVPGTSEFVIELKKDWTQIYDTATSKDNYYNDKFRIVIEEGAVTNKTNGAKNDEIVLDLNYSGSALNAPDTKSAAISKIEETAKEGQFIVTMDEPVKLEGKENAEVGDTPNQTQETAGIPTTSVQFIGKDKDGKTRTIDGTVGNYADKNGADTKFYVKWNTVDGEGAFIETPQSIVNAGGSQDWKLVVKSLSDDVGNTVATATKDFKLTKEVIASPFEIKKYTFNNGPFETYFYNVIGEFNGDEKDTVTMTFTEGVQFNGGDYDATSTSQYMLNGKTLPVGTSIAVEDSGDGRENGLETVIIKLPDETLLEASNVITVNKNLVSHDGTVLTGEYEVEFFVCDNFSRVLAKNGPTN